MIDEVARFAVQAEPGPAALQSAALCLVDTIGVMLAGSAHPDVRVLEGSLPAAASSDATAACLWSDRSFCRDDAALLYGMASHILDYDDVSLLAICHPSVPVVSALAAWSAGRDISGRAFLAAYAIGTEVLIRIGEVMGPVHYALGFHATATLGTIGAAAALARLSGLDQERTREALNIAASLAGGLQSNFGSSVKSLHVGFAASAAVRAVDLAQAGLTASADAFAPRGFFHAFSGGEVDAWAAPLNLGAPFAIERPGFEQKRFPCCYMLHRMLAGTLALRERHSLDLENVRAIVLRYPTGGTVPLRYPRPTSGMQGLFSAPYACLSALADGRVNLASFSDSAVRRPAIQARIDDVSVIETSELLREGGLSTSPVEVELELQDRRIVSIRIDRAPGSHEDPLTDDQRSAKWIDCLRQPFPAIDSSRAKAAYDAGVRIAADGVMPWFEQIRGLACSAVD
ncbi:MmgE/PrpD family protein [Sphingobium sp. SA916]|uniref:MmgE/PrpD family protein n=1 Tax=Sphingobium sp. SA916 TaxID=1851207 RepID=UPI000CA87487|nr:MmgE/PrpD family protein [Sphingobium sp. SA916]PNP96733.1 hypothetical protein A8G00_23090 [Sphingobium sp. SA916]